jgi:hypothetical protein
MTALPSTRRTGCRAHALALALRDARSSRFDVRAGLELIRNWACVARERCLRRGTDPRTACPALRKFRDRAAAAEHPRPWRMRGHDQNPRFPRSSRHVPSARKCLAAMAVHNPPGWQSGSARFQESARRVLTSMRVSSGRWAISHCIRQVFHFSPCRAIERKPLRECHARSRPSTGPHPRSRD